MCLCIAHSPLSILTVGTFIVNATLLDTDAALANTRCMRVHTVALLCSVSQTHQKRGTLLNLHTQQRQCGVCPTLRTGSAHSL
jgi:hypothetical protein